MVDPTEPAPYDDINEAVGEEWEARTTPYERVREIISRTYTPVSAEAIAEDARTSPKTARKHLDSLVDGGFITTETGEKGGTYYRRSSESLVVEQAADILSQVPTDELIDRITEMRETVSEFQSKYGVESPEELSVERTNEVLSRAETVHDEIDEAAIREWKTTRRNLAFANAALSIANAQKFVNGEPQSSNGSVSSP